MDRPLRFAILAGDEAPYLGFICDALFELDMVPHCVIVDSRRPTAKDIEIEKERTEGKLVYGRDGKGTLNQVSRVHLDNHNSKETIDCIKSNDIELLISAGTPRILGSEILRAPPNGILNCHPGILPHFRGCTCVEWAIYLDQPVGNSVHFMSPGIDEGPVVMTEECPIVLGDSYSDVRVRVYRHGFGLLARAAKYVSTAHLCPAEFPPQGRGTYYKPINTSALQEARKKINNGTYKYFDSRGSACAI